MWVFLSISYMCSQILYFSLRRAELGCSLVEFGHYKTVLNTISPLLVLKLVVTQNYLFFPPSFFLVLAEVLDGLVGSCGQAVKYCVSIKCSSQLFVVDQIHFLSWAGIQLQDRCFTVLFIGFATQRAVLHTDREQVACRQKRSHHLFVFFLLFTDSCDILIAAGCVKRQGWRYPCRLPFHITQTQTLIQQDLCFL